MVAGWGGIVSHGRLLRAEFRPVVPSLCIATQIVSQLAQFRVPQNGHTAHIASDQRPGQIGKPHVVSMDAQRRDARTYTGTVEGLLEIVRHLPAASIRIGPDRWRTRWAERCGQCWGPLWFVGCFGLINSALSCHPETIRTLPRCHIVIFFRVFGCRRIYLTATTPW